jgi:multiple sugar transport system substrate-binding protein
MEELVK